MDTLGQRGPRIHRGVNRGVKSLIDRLWSRGRVFLPDFFAVALRPAQCDILKAKARFFTPLTLRSEWQDKEIIDHPVLLFPRKKFINLSSWGTRSGWRRISPRKVFWQSRNKKSKARFFPSTVSIWQSEIKGEILRSAQNDMLRFWVQVHVFSTNTKKLLASIKLGNLKEGKIEEIKLIKNA